MIAGKHACQYINASKKFFWVDYFDTEIQSKENITIVANIILPVKNYDEAMEIASTKKLKLDDPGIITVSFNRNGEEYSFKLDR